MCDCTYPAVILPSCSRSPVCILWIENRRRREVAANVILPCPAPPLSRSRRVIFRARERILGAILNKSVENVITFPFSETNGRGRLPDWLRLEFSLKMPRARKSDGTYLGSAKLTRQTLARGEQIVNK